MGLLAESDMIAQTSGRVVESVVVAIGIDGSLSSKKLTALIVSCC